MKPAAQRAVKPRAIRAQRPAAEGNPVTDQLNQTWAMLAHLGEIWDDYAADDIARPVWGSGRLDDIAWRRAWRRSVGVAETVFPGVI